MKHEMALQAIDERFDLHKLRIFAMVARMGSFTKAAERMHMTQPTVSQQIALLETSLNVHLIERDTRHLSLTAAGRVLLDYAERILSLARDAAEATCAAAGLADQTLRLGIGQTLATYLLPDLLRRYRNQYPAYRTQIVVGNTSGLLTQLANSEIDVALVGSPAEHRDILIEPFMHDRLVVIVSAEDELAVQTTVTLDVLRKRTFLTREPGSALHANVARLLGAEFVLGSNVIVLGETEAIKRSVEAGLGVAVIQRIAIERELVAGNLVALTLDGINASRTYLIARRRRSETLESVTALVKLLHEA